MKPKNKKQQKSPILAAILNFLFPGIGYVYTGKRIVFGIGIFILILSSVVLSFFDTALINLPTWDFDFVYTIIAFVFCFFFAYDAYETAQEVNQVKK